jgi:hypothetical protein
MHSEFCDIVMLANEVADLGHEDSMDAVGRRWSLAIDILSKTARVHSGAQAILGRGHASMQEFARGSYCLSWYRDFARLRNTGCDLDHATLQMVTCDRCRDGYLPCKSSLETSPHVKRGMDACKEMRNRYEHYEGYFLGKGNEQKRGRERDGLNQRAASKPCSEPWVSESPLGGSDGLEIRIDVYERGGLRAFVLDVGKTVSGLKPVVRAATQDPQVSDPRHEEACPYCR